jgi:tRNA-dihydrouridine synthase B
MSCGGWIGMLKNKSNTLNIIKQIADSITLPFSIKTRIWFNDFDRDEQIDFILKASEYCHTITIHGRTYRQSHSGWVDRDFIYNIKNILGDRVTVFGNGGIKSYQDALDHKWNLDGIMIGQSSIGNPWILTPITPTLHMRYDTIIKHLNMACVWELYFADTHHFDDTREYFIQPSLQQLEKESIWFATHPDRNQCYTVVEFRKFLFNYIHGLPNNKELKMQVAHIKTYDQLVDEINKYFDVLRAVDS